MKKISSYGFTLVEMAIVLLIIGIIMAMAVKGRELMIEAALVADVSKIRKTEVAANIFYAKHQTYPQSFEEMETEGMITKGEVTSSFYKSGARDAGNIAGQKIYYGICKTHLVHNISYTYLETDPLNDMLIVCGKGITINNNLIYPTMRYYCEFENRIDDSNITTGKGRGVRMNNDMWTPPATFYDNCRIHGGAVNTGVDSWGLSVF